MHNLISVNTEIMASDIESMRTQLQGVRDATNKLYESVAVLNGMWEGPAHDAFISQFIKDQQDMLSLCTTIETLINIMTTAKTEYNNCERVVTDIVASIRI